MSPEEALGRLALELEGTSAYRDYVVPLMRPVARYAQLEKVAAEAKATVDGGFLVPGRLLIALGALERAS